MKTWLKSILGGLVGAAAVVATIWLASLPQTMVWVKGSEGYAAWAAILLNCVGLWFIFRQLGLTQMAAESAEKSADAARASTEIALADTRPWLHVEIEEGSARANLREGPPRILHCFMRVVVTNIGRTPARDVTCHFMPLTDSSDENLQSLVKDLPGSGLQKTTIFPGEERYFGHGKPVEIEGKLFPVFKALIVLEYTSATGRHLTPFLATELPWEGSAQRLGERVAEVVEEVRTVLQPT